jgi:hypothetical protein
MFFFSNKLNSLRLNFFEERLGNLQRTRPRFIGIRMYGSTLRGETGQFATHAHALP